MFRKFLALISFAMIVAGVGATASSYLAYIYLTKGHLQEDKIIVVKKGASVGQIADILESEGVVSSAVLFNAATRIAGIHNSLKAGEYMFPAGITTAGVMDMIAEGQVHSRKITISEGLTSYQIVRLLNSNDDFAGDRVTEIPEEGSLLPETYSYTMEDSRADILERMKNSMRKAVPDVWDSSLPFGSRREIVTLASIVEKETGKASERRRVAGVFINRLNKGMRLQSDPTVIYAITHGKIKEGGKGPLGRRILRSDLKVDSPYNTYMYKGLPPGPIANPGKASIDAVLNPERHEYLYFVADGTGGHVFSRTLAEHKRNVAKWRKIRHERRMKERAKKAE